MNLIHKIKNAPREVLKDRILLFSIIIFVWALTELLEILIPEKILNFLPGPFQIGLLFVIFFFLTIYSIVVYIVQRRKFRSERDIKILNENYPSVDIFIAAHNEDSVIVETLQNILEIDYPNFKITIIDDRSKDQTSKVIEDFLNENSELRNKVKLTTRLEGQTPGKAASLNEALENSLAEYILVCDADAKIDPICLKRAIPFFSSANNIAAIQFQKRISNTNYNVLTLCQDLEMAFDTYIQSGKEALKGFVELRGNGQLFSRKALLDVKGWDERTLTEDLEISIRFQIQGWRIIFVPEIHVYEEAVITATALLKQRKRWIEGSLRRFLTHFHSFISPRNKLTLLQRLDVFPFVIQFAVPVWLFLDIFMQIVYFINHQPTSIPLLTAAIIVISLLFWINIIIGIRYWRRKYSFSRSLTYGSLAFLYGIIQWPTLVIWSMRKVLFSRNTTKWVKTPRMAEK